VTAAVPAPILGLVAAIAPELMTFPLAATPSVMLRREPGAGVGRQCGFKARGPSLVSQAFVDALTAGKTVMAIGPGLGRAGDSQIHHCVAVGDEDAGGD